MKHLRLNTIIFVLITFLGTIILMIALSIRIEFKEPVIERLDDHNDIRMSNGSNKEQKKFDSDHFHFKMNTLEKFAKNNQNIIKNTARN